MSATSDVAYNLAKLKKEDGESDEQLARRMYYLQMEIYSANAMTTLYRHGDFENLPKNIQRGWLASARRKEGRKK